MPSLLRWCYLALIAWQVIWLGFLPDPLGPGLGGWAVLLTAPLLLPLRGVWKTDARGINWASYLLILYFLLGVGEAWANAEQRIPAVLQLLLVCACLVAIGTINLSRKRAFRAR